MCSVIMPPGVNPIAVNKLYNISYQIFLILRRNERDMIKTYIGLHVKYHLFLSDFNET